MVNRRGLSLRRWSSQLHCLKYQQLPTLVTLSIAKIKLYWQLKEYNIQQWFAWKSHWVALNVQYRLCKWIETKEKCQHNASLSLLWLYYYPSRASAYTSVSQLYQHLVQSVKCAILYTNSKSMWHFSSV